MQTSQGASLNGHKPHVRCAACGRPFERKSRARSLYCSTACRRRARSERERDAYHERKHLTSEVVTRTVTEMWNQVERDESGERPAQWPAFQLRVAALVDAREAMLAGEQGANFAYRQELLHCAAAAVQMAARLPRPTVKLPSDQRDVQRARRTSA